MSHSADTVDASWPSRMIYKSLLDLKRWPLEEWQKIPANVCENLIKNYRKRVWTVNEAKGYTINYLVTSDQYFCSTYVRSLSSKICSHYDTKFLSGGKITCNLTHFGEKLLGCWSVTSVSMKKRRKILRGSISLSSAISFTPVVSRKAKSANENCTRTELVLRCSYYVRSSKCHPKSKCLSRANLVSGAVNLIKEV